jgi:hypothetical protein
VIYRRFPSAAERLFFSRLSTGRSFWSAVIYHRFGFAAERLSSRFSCGGAASLFIHAIVDRFGKR